MAINVIWSQWDFLSEITHRWSFHRIMLIQAKWFVHITYQHDYVASNLSHFSWKVIRQIDILVMCVIQLAFIISVDYLGTQTLGRCTSILFVTPSQCASNKSEKNKPTWCVHLQRLCKCGFILWFLFASSFVQCASIELKWRDKTNVQRSKNDARFERKKWILWKPIDFLEIRFGCLNNRNIKTWTTKKTVAADWIERSR